MNRSMVVYVTGRILLVLGVVMSVMLPVAVIYQEPWQVMRAILCSMGVTIGVGLLLSSRRPVLQSFYMREGLVIAGISWLLISFFGALPFTLSGAIPSMVDAFFESASGFTTTGSTILPEVEVLPQSLMFWRSFMHFIGGMGVLVFALAVLPNNSAQTAYLMKAEVPGPTFGKLLPHITETARTLYVLYAVFTFVLIVVLAFCGMPLFDAFIHAFGTAGTGGFSNHTASVAFYQSPLIEVVLGIGMLVFGCNFNLYYFWLRGDRREVLKNEELRWYLGIVGIAVLLLSVVTRAGGTPLWVTVKDAFFIVSSIITTTGFGTVDFDQWTMFARWILLLLMFSGACAGSTAGGLKVTRLNRMFKVARATVQRTLHPKRLTAVQVEGRNLKETDQTDLGAYLMLYLGTFALLMLIVSLDNMDFITTFSAVTTTFNNVGPGMGAVGPTANFSGLSDLSKVALSIGMIAGRLEIFPIIALLLPHTWRLK